MSRSVELDTVLGSVEPDNRCQKAWNWTLCWDLDPLRLYVYPPSPKSYALPETRRRVWYGDMMERRKEGLGSKNERLSRYFEVRVLEWIMDVEWEMIQLSLTHSQREEKDRMMIDDRSIDLSVYLSRRRR